jgi:sugar phosphate isomerase/epimerase
MRPLAFSTNAFKQHTLAEAIDAIASAGYAGVELMADVPHAYPPNLDAAERRRLARQIADRGLTVSNINAFTLFAEGDTYHPTWIEDDQVLRRRRIAHTVDAIELAAELCCKTVSVQPGGPLIGTTITRPDAERRFADGIAACLDIARRAGVVIAVEPEPGLLIESWAELSAWRSAFFADEPLVAMNCDVGHLYCVGEDPGAIIHQADPLVAHVHLEDIASNRVHQHLLPGRGAIDFAGIFSALETIRYTGWVTVELYPYEVDAATVAQMALAYLKPLLPR